MNEIAKNKKTISLQDLYKKDMSNKQKKVKEQNNVYTRRSLKGMNVPTTASLAL